MTKKKLRRWMRFVEPLPNETFPPPRKWLSLLKASEQQHKVALPARGQSDVIKTFLSSTNNESSRGELLIKRESCLFSLFGCTQFLRQKQFSAFRTRAHWRVVSRKFLSFALSVMAAEHYERCTILVSFLQQLLARGLSRVLETTKQTAPSAVFTFMYKRKLFKELSR